MKNLKRIIFEVVIIASVFAAVNLCYSKWIPAGDEVDLMGFPPSAAKTVDAKTVIKWLDAWKKAESEVKVMGKIPALGYDSKSMKLQPFDIPVSKLKYRYDPKFIDYVSQALFRNSVVSSTDDLEKRVRKLENTVNRILAKCCPKAK